MVLHKKNKCFISPSDRELMEAVIKATCEYYEISEDELLTISKKADPVNIKRMCVFLIMSNTQLKDYVVAQRFNTSRSAIVSAVDIISSHKKIYRQTSDNLNSIAVIANTFTKKFSWHIQ